MAFRLKHAAGVIVLGWAATTTAYLPPHHVEPRQFRIRPDERLSVRLRYEAAMLTLAQSRDQAVEAIARQPRATPAVWIDPSIPPMWQREFRRVTDSAWALLGITQSHVPVSVAFVLDSNWHSGAVRYLLPTNATDPCLVIVSYAPRWAAWSWKRVPGDQATSLMASQIPGPCAFYAAYGVPGGKIGAWLARGGGGYGVWSEGGTLRPALEPRAAMDVWRSYLEEPMWGWAGLACRRGNEASCVRVLRLADNARSFSLSPTRGRGWISAAPMALSLDGSHLLGDLRKDQGADRFGRFWHSDLAVDSAFNAAFTMSLGTWIARWSANYPQDDIRTVQPLSVVLSLTTIGLLFAISVALAQRRQVE